MRHFLPILALLTVFGCTGNPLTIVGVSDHPFRTDLKHEKYLATAQQPIATGYPVSTQYTMQSMHHWDLLAGKIARQGSQALNHFFAGTDMGVYVAPAGTTPFSKAYREALITQLFAYGVPIAFSPEGSVTLEVQIEMRGPVRRVADDGTQSKRKKHPGVRRTAEPEFLQGKNAEGKYQRLPVVSEEEGYFGSNHSKAEIQVNTSLVHPRGYIYRDSSIFYVEASQLRNYLHRPGIEDNFLKRYVIVDN
jgi:hypothetical protein